ncbi:MAG: hypothetical protein KJ601_02220 [Nanoarchaeota archaeon]|nr:hypothetical protein [Nanoarchaeota archaeon]MBU1704578.1 hypothetical protein [Nanoarchaeota archaeon]
MAKKSRVLPTRKQIFTLAIVLSLFMYLAGVFSGLFANKIMEKKVEEDIGFLTSYTDIASLDLKNMLLQQLLIDQLPNTCRSTEIYLDNLRKQLEPYWEKLPARMESYDKQGKATEQYLSIKREYIRLSLRIWLIAKQNSERCDSSLTPILYFYSGECDTCVRQGEIFDELNQNMKEVNQSVVVFPIDLNFEDDNVYFLKKYYNVTSVPTLIVGNTIMRANIIPAKNIVQVIEKYY